MSIFWENCGEVRSIICIKPCHGVDINKKNDKFDNILLDTAVNFWKLRDDHGLVLLLLQHGADVDKAQASTKDKIVQMPFYQQLQRLKK